MIKKHSYSYFNKDCINCANKNICISAGAFHQGLRKYFLHLKGYEYPTNESMIIGKEWHNSQQKDIKTIEEYGIANFLKDLPSGKNIILSELGICSPLYALKGVLDIVRFKYYAKSNTLKINITELKSNFNRKYILQLVAYCLILSDNNCLIRYNTNKGMKTQKLYPEMDILKFINANLKIKNGDKYSQLFMVGNIMTDWGKNLSAAVLSKKQKYKYFHQAGIYFLHEIPVCKGCSNNCPYFDICKKYEYNSHKIKQRYFGKRSILVKTKPKIL